MPPATMGGILQASPIRLPHRSSTRTMLPKATNSSTSTRRPFQRATGRSSRAFHTYSAATGTYSLTCPTCPRQVYWTMMDDVPLPPAIVSRFANGTIAIMGYETDQFRQLEDGVLSSAVPLCGSVALAACLLGCLASALGSGCLHRLLLRSNIGMHTQDRTTRWPGGRTCATTSRHGWTAP